MSRWLELSKLLAQAAALGAEFTAVGDRVEYGGCPLPPDLAERLSGYADLLPAYLGINDSDAEAVRFFDQLGVTLELIETVEGCLPALEALDASAAANGLPIALDIETAARPLEAAPKPAVRLNKTGALSARQAKPADDGAALSPHRGYVALLQLYAGGDRVYLFRGEALRAMLRSRWLRTRHFVAHNAKFDRTWLRHSAAKLNTPPLPADLSPGHWDCTLQAAGLVLGTGHAGESRRLENVAEKLLGLSPPKQLALSVWTLPTLTRGQLAYAASDAVLVRRIWAQLAPELDRPIGSAWFEPRRRDAYELQRGCGDAVGDMELRGVGIDREEFTRQLDQWTHDLCKARAAYTAETGEQAPSTPAELRLWLQGVLSPDTLHTWPRTPKSRELATDEAALSMLHANPAARAVLRMLQTNKLIRSFGQKFIAKLNPVTGRFHASFNIAAAKTGRFSCNEPNLQQLPSKRAPDFRKVIVAEDGYVLIGGDYAQVEVRAAAWISSDQELTAVFKRGDDIHREAASSIGRIAADEVTDRQRTAAKAIVFGSLFGMGAVKLAAYAHQSYGVEMSVEDAGDALSNFFTRFRGFRQWRHDNARDSQARGYIRIPSGRIIDVDWDVRKQRRLEFTLCCNAPIQGACADLLMLALRLTYERLNENGICGEHGGLIACVHDELLLEVREDLAEQAADILQTSMVDAFVSTFPKAPTEKLVTAKIGRTWRDIK